VIWAFLARPQVQWEALWRARVLTEWLTAYFLLNHHGAVKWSSAALLLQGRNLAMVK